MPLRAPATGARLRELVAASQVWALLGITALAAVLRFATLDTQSFSADEAFTVGTVINGDLSHLLSVIAKNESVPPTFPILLSGWTEVFGDGEVGARSLSALFGVATVPAAYAAGTELLSRRVGLIAAALVAVNPLLIWYSQEARPYALLALAGTLSFWAFLRAASDPSWRRLGWWAAASALAIGVHYFAVFLVAPEAAWLFIRYRRRRAAAVSFGAVAVIGAALAPLALQQADERTTYIGSASLSSRVEEVPKQFLNGPFGTHSDLLAASVVLVVVAGLALGVARSDLSERRRVLAPVLIGGAAVALPVALAVAGADYLNARNVIAAVPVLLLALAACFGAPRLGRVGPAGAAVLCGLFLAVALAVPGDPTLQREDYRGMAAALGLPSVDRVVVAEPRALDAFELYLRGALPLPGSGGNVREVDVVAPVPRRGPGDEHPGRQATDPPPAGFEFVSRRDADSFTLVRYRSRRPVRVYPRPLAALDFDKSSRFAAILVQAGPRHSSDLRLLK